jgi:site-specific DNA-methyltransferase (adenine-specific)
MIKVNINQVKANPKNPRVIKDDKFKKLVKSIQEFPDMLNKRPLIVFTDVDGKYVVLGGNMRLKACNELGIKEIPIIVADEWTEEQKNEFLIKDNVGFGEWDWDDLVNEWDADKLTEWGLDIPNFETETHLEAEEDDFDETPPVEPITVLGDIYEIGEHRLLCGDSTDSDVVAKLMNGEKADMVFTDPPYLMGFEGGMQTNENGNWTKSFNAKHGEIKNDKLSKNEENDFLDSINSNIQLFNKGAFYICFYRLGLGGYFASLERTGIKVRTLITWNKGNHTLSNSDYWSKCEHIFYGWIDEHNFYGKNDFDIWDIARTQKNDLHPTMKPIPLCEKAINNSSKQNDLVFDLFLGSGSTMVASQQLKRKCYGMELDPKYCDVIVKRMIKLDPTLSVKRNGVECKKDFE